MKIGYTISGVAHVSLIGWVLFGGAFTPTSEPVEVTEVVAISEAEFESLLAGIEPPETVTDIVVPDPVAPVVPDPTPPQPSEVDQPPALSQPDEAIPPRPEARPEPPEIAPPDQTEVSDDVAVLTPPDDLPDTPETPAPINPTRPNARPADRVAPEAVAPPEPDEVVADIAQDVATDDSTGDEQLPDQEKTVEEAASTEIVTEANEGDSTAPTRSLRPKTRPQRPTRQAEADPEPTDTTQSAVDDLLASLTDDSATPNPTPNSTPARPSGPPLTSGEKDALRVAVQKCWNTGSLSTEALKTTVIVGVSMNEDGTPDVGTIRLIDSAGGSGGSVNQAFQAARRAIIRCGSRGFALPSEKYEQWRDIEMTFNPEKMRIK